MAKGKRKGKKGKKKNDLKKKKKRKEKKGKTKYVFALDPEDEKPEAVIEKAIGRLKRARKLTHRRNINELRFASDILHVISEVVIRYDRELAAGGFSNSVASQYLFRTFNYMLAADQNIEKMLAESPFDFLDEYVKTRNLGDDNSVPKKGDKRFIGKLGRMGKTHSPLISKKKRKKKGDKKKK